MRAFVYRQFFFLLPLMLFMLFLVAPFAVTGEPMVEWYRVFRARNKEITDVFKFVSEWGNLPLLAPYAALLFMSIRRKSARGVNIVLTFALIQYALVMGLVHVLKICIGAPRPFVTNQELYHHFTLESRFQSFPSGHTAEAIGNAAPLAHKESFTKNCFHAFLWGIFPGIVAYSRIFLGRHHPIDLLGGTLLATLGTALILYLLKGPPLWERFPLLGWLPEKLPWLCQKDNSTD